MNPELPLQFLGGPADGLERMTSFTGPGDDGEITWYSADCCQAYGVEYVWFGESDQGENLMIEASVYDSWI